MLQPPAASPTLSVRAAASMALLHRWLLRLTVIFPPYLRDRNGPSPCSPSSVTAAGLMEARVDQSSMLAGCLLSSRTQRAPWVAEDQTRAAPMALSHGVCAARQGACQLYEARSRLVPEKNCDDAQCGTRAPGGARPRGDAPRGRSQITMLRSPTGKQGPRARLSLVQELPEHVERIGDSALQGAVGPKAREINAEIDEDSG